MERMRGIPSGEIPEEIRKVMAVQPAAMRADAFNRLVAGNPGFERFRSAVCRELPEV